MKDKDIIPDCKVTLVGDSGVGKSAIIGRYISGIFREDLVSTSGANYSQKIYKKNNQKVRLNIWDTVGQEKYRALGRNFYKDSYIICIIFDITNKISFKNVKEIWYPEIKQYGEKYNILSIVGNKCDLYESEEVNDEEANEFANEVGAQYFSVSAKNGNGIEDMFNTLANLYLDPKFKEKIDGEKSFRKNSIKLEKRHLENKNISTQKKGCC